MLNTNSQIMLQCFFLAAAFHEYIHIFRVFNNKPSLSTSRAPQSLLKNGAHPAVEAVLSAVPALLLEIAGIVERQGLRRESQLFLMSWKGLSWWV